MSISKFAKRLIIAAPLAAFSTPSLADTAVIGLSSQWGQGGMAISAPIKVKDKKTCLLLGKHMADAWHRQVTVSCFDENNDLIESQHCARPKGVYEIGKVVCEPISY